jgi:hypothetical protein
LDEIEEWLEKWDGSHVKRTLSKQDALHAIQELESLLNERLNSMSLTKAAAIKK